MYKFNSKYSVSMAWLIPISATKINYYLFNIFIINSDLKYRLKLNLT